VAPRGPRSRLGCRRPSLKDSSADALPGANARANNVVTSTQEPIMTPRTPDNIWSLATLMGRNAIPPRDPNDDDDEDQDDQEDEDGEEDPAVVREPDE
jgi:hypothetical protein